MWCGKTLAIGAEVFFTSRMNEGNPGIDGKERKEDEDKTG